MCSVICLIADISIAAVDLLQEMTDVESDEDNEDAINAFFDALVSCRKWRIYFSQVSCIDSRGIVHCRNLIIYGSLSRMYSM